MTLRILFAADKTLYDRESRTCSKQSKQFLDPSFGIEAAIGWVLKVIGAGLRDSSVRSYRIQEEAHWGETRLGRRCHQ
jgi:hypothetical protein